MTDEQQTDPSAAPPSAAPPAAAPPAAAPPIPVPPVTPQPQVRKKKSNVINPYIWGTGRRKSAVARVRIRPGDGVFQVNKKDVDVFFCLDKDRFAVRQPLNITDTLKSFDVFVNVGGGGITGQAGAIVLGLARALAKANADHEPKLRGQQLLSRDPRRVERKKYGRRGARRGFQFSKR